MSVLRHKIKLAILTVFFAVFLCGCKVEYQTMSADMLYKMMEDTLNNSSRSWWVLGEDNEQYFLMEKKSPFDKEFYAVKKSDVYIVGQNKDYPFSLKYKDIEFIR